MIIKTIAGWVKEEAGTFSDKTRQRPGFRHGSRNGGKETWDDKCCEKPKTNLHNGRL